ncbi:XkdX family protein [Sporosarcina sp. FSL K6-1508]|uniref:XkdX family protein n=1 Tax=Sporosarcina sp. FSL K6-1508 TaxID=2921553 RepID=UPI0030F83D78
MTFWENAFLWGWADVALLRMVVKTEQMPFGEITKEDFKRITGEDFDSEVPAE